MAVEHARTHALPKPWGAADLRPWSNARHDGNPIGEIWYERPAGAAVDSSLLLKLLFTSQPLSIQVHPDDAFALSTGLARGKSEAWYVLSAAPEAKIALGLKQRITPQQLREAVDDGSIADLVAWRAVSPGDVIFVPAGTIHAIGAGLVIAEIQQRSDATFRLFDHGRRRELHIESAVAVANPGPADFPAQPNRLTGERTILVSSPHFVFEKFDLPPDSAWRLEAEQETWLLVVNGSARAGSFDVVTGDTVFVQSDRVDIHAGADGMAGLVAYTGVGQAPRLFRRLKQPGAIDAERPRKIRATTAATNRRPETTK
ncbi:MAG: class I mannose-6-phosphate isomerase [Xanthobacteraceae bacterium]